MLADLGKSLITGRWVEKQGKGTFGNKWQKRWIVQDGPFLKYYLSPQHVNPQGQIDFSQVEEVRLATKGAVGAGNVTMYPFEVAMQAHLKRVYCIRTEKDEDREFLVSALQTLLNQCKTGSAPAPDEAVAQDPEAREQATLDELSSKIKELSKDIEGRITLRRFYTLVQDEERVTKDKEGNVTSSKTVEVKKRIMDKECLLDVTAADIINMEFNLDALKQEKAAQQAKNIRIVFKMDNSMYGVLSKQWEELGSENGCQESSHLSKWQHTDHVVPNLLYRPELVKSSGLFNKLITDFVKNTFVVPVAVTFDLEALHARAKAADADTPSAMSHPNADTAKTDAQPVDEVIDMQESSPAVAGGAPYEEDTAPPPAYDMAAQPSDQASFDAAAAAPPTYPQDAAAVPGPQDAASVPQYPQGGDVPQYPQGVGAMPQYPQEGSAVPQYPQQGAAMPQQPQDGAAPAYPQAGGAYPPSYPANAGGYPQYGGAPPPMYPQDPTGAQGAPPMYPQQDYPQQAPAYPQAGGAANPGGAVVDQTPVPSYPNAPVGDTTGAPEPAGADAPPPFVESTTDLAEPQLDNVGAPPPFEE